MAQGFSNHPGPFIMKAQKRRHRTLAVIMGGGRRTRLSPLTSERCKPAVPLAGKFRLVDIPISNCLNSEINRIFLLTQFQTASLHRHVTSTYNFDPFGGGFDVRIGRRLQIRTSVDWDPTFLSRAKLTTNSEGRFVPTERRKQSHGRLSLGVVWRF